MGLTELLYLEGALDPDGGKLLVKALDKRTGQRYEISVPYDDGASPATQWGDLYSKSTAKPSDSIPTW